MNRLCPVRIICPGPQPGLDGDSPVSNYTAELPDTLTFEGFTYPIFDNNNTIGGTDTTGNFPQWLAQGCQNLCISFLSADDAGACAARQAFMCAHTPPTGTPPTFFFNQQQSCSFTCPDGTLYTYTVLPGYFVRLSLAEANELAFALACERAIVNHVCFGTLTPGACPNAPYGSTMQLFGNFPLGVSVVSGSLPPGFLMQQDPAGKTVTIFGTCAVPGGYQFALMATDPLGNFHVKTFAISILQMTNLGSPPLAGQNQTYSFQIQGQGGFAPYTFSVASGSLPPGLTLSSSGLISGTPTMAGTSNATIQMTDANGGSCTQPIVLMVSTCAGVFGNPPWNITNPGGGTGTFSGSASGTHFSLFSSATAAQSPAQAQADFGNTGPELPYTLGTALPCKLTVSVSASGVTSSIVQLNARLLDNSIINLFSQTPVAAGTSVFSFTIPANCKSLLFAGVVAGGDGLGNAGTIQMNGNFSS